MIIAALGCKKDCYNNQTHCDDLITDTLGTHDSCRVYMPNAFTPNGDGINDHLVPITLHIRSIEFNVYDDCDNLVYSTNQLWQGWEANSISNKNQVFYYTIQAISQGNHHIGLCGETIALQCMPRGCIQSNYSFGDQFGSDGFEYTSAEMLQECR